MMYDFMLEIAKGVGFIAWVLTGGLLGGLTIGRVSPHIDGGGIVMLLVFIYLCIMMGPFAVVFWLFKRIAP